MVFALSIHADFACAHSGACCTSGWPIPVELQTFEALSDRFPAGKFVAVAGAPPDTPRLAAVDAHGTCAFYERDSGLCAIHRQAGQSLLPVACRQFPRVTLLDARGLFVNLSHYCPTAAALLLRDDRPLEIVESPAAFPADFGYDPLDARYALPPLLRPSVLLDLQAFDCWERAVIAVFGRDNVSAEQALKIVAGFTEAMRAWTPERGDLPRYVDEVMNGAGEAGGAGEPDEAGGPSGAAVSLVLGAIPDGLRPVIALDRARFAYSAWVEGSWNAFAGPVRRYLAAKAFGSWLAYQGYGLRTIVSFLATALSLLKACASVECDRRRAVLTRDVLVAAFRRTDELLLHLSSREALAEALSGIEKVDRGISHGVR